MEDSHTLFAVFIPRRAKNKVLKLIKANYDIEDKRIFVLEDNDDPDTYILTFNGKERAIGSSDTGVDVPPVRNVISIHRKKINNVLYTVNALNELVKLETGGKEDHSHEINWRDNKYKNKFIVTRNKELKFISTNLKTIVLLDKIEDYK